MLSIRNYILQCANLCHRVINRSSRRKAHRLWGQIKREEKNYESVMDDIARKSLKQKSQLLSLWARTGAPKPSTSTDSGDPETITTALVTEAPIVRSGEDVQPSTSTAAVVGQTSSS